MGALSEWIENRTDPAERFLTPAGQRVRLGPNPRALIMCEESGGAILGGAELLWNKSRDKAMVALREKDGMQIALFALSLAAHLHNSGGSFAEFYCESIKHNGIVHKYFKRRDVRLYDESLIDAEREAAKMRGVDIRDRVMAFFKRAAQEFESARPVEEICAEINERLTDGCKPITHPDRIQAVGDGILIEWNTSWCLIRPSGTEAVLRYYVEAPSKKEIESILAAFINLQV
jgi:phosphomannomutase